MRSSYRGAQPGISSRRTISSRLTVRERPAGSWTIWNVSLGNWRLVSLGSRSDVQEWSTSPVLARGALPHLLPTNGSSDRHLAGVPPGAALDRVGRSAEPQERGPVAGAA